MPDDDDKSPEEQDRILASVAETKELSLEEVDRIVAAKDEVPEEEPADEEMSDKEVALSAAQQAWERIRTRTHQLWDDWVLIGDALEIGRTEAIYTSQAKGPSGQRYSRAFSAWLKSNGFEDLHETTRAHLLKIMDEFDAVDAWRDTLDEDKWQKWNHPSTVWQHFNAWKRREGKQDKPPRQTQRAANVVLQAENDSLNQRVQDLETEINQGGVAERDTIAEVLKAVDRRFEDDDLADLIDGLITMAHRRGIKKTWGRKCPLNNTDSTADGPGIPQA